MIHRALKTVLILISITGFQGGARGAEASPVEVTSPVVGSEGPSYTFTGTLSARQRAQLSPRVSGLVQTADLEVGDHFEAGETILQLDPTLAEIELRLRKADLALAESEFEEAERLLEEADRLGDSGFPRSERLSRASSLNQAKVRLSRAKAELEAQEERSRRHRVPAPFPGTIARKLTEVGEWVETGSPVAELIGDELRLEVRVPQERILEAGQTETVEVRVQGLPDREIDGRVEALAPVVDPGTRTFLVRIAIEDPPSLLTAGMSAIAVFRPDDGSEALRIPRDAVIRNEAGETLVWTVADSGDEQVARSRLVSLGESRGSETIVRSGLSEESIVVVRGNESLREDQPVRIVERPGESETTSD